MFIALVHAIFHFIMHAWKGRKRAQLEKNEIFIYLKLIHTFPREIFATYVLLQRFCLYKKGRKKVQTQAFYDLT